jgi:DNA-binding SARP family transcriptional activator
MELSVRSIERNLGMPRKSSVNRDPMAEAGSVPPLAPNLIRRKLQVPELPDHFAGRARVRSLVSGALKSGRVVVVAAAAGSGKTSAIVDSCAHERRPVAWLTVDRPDSAPGRLLTYLEAAIGGSRPSASRVATTALAAGAPHAEAAGLLAQATGDEPIVVVLDEFERLGQSPQAWAVIEALIRYASPQTSIVLVGREDPPVDVVAAAARRSVVWLDDDALAFTVDEAARALVKSGRHDTDPSVAVERAGGWVAGVLFQDGPAGGVGGLHDYLAAQVIDRLPGELKNFMITTSLLDQVTPERAGALGYTDAASRLAALRPLHLPVVWSDDSAAMTCHTAIREHLLALLRTRDAEEVRELRRLHARLLAAEGHHEEAVEEFVKAGAVEEGLPSADRAILAAVRRMDFAVAERWLLALAEHDTAGLTVGRLLIALARDDIVRAVAIADRAREHHRETPRSVDSERAAYLMAWSYFHQARWHDIEEVMLGISSPAAIDALRLGIGVLGGPGADRLVPCPPAPVNGPAEALINIGKYGYGRLTELTETSESSWDASVRKPWSIAALRALGHTQEALDAYRASEQSGTSRITMLTFVGADVLIDAGLHDEARRVIEESTRLAVASGSLIFQGAARLSEAKYRLRVARDPAAAHAALDTPELARAVNGYARMGEIAAMWRGLAYLLEERNEEALECLQSAAHSMSASERILELPTAGVYLAEAEWRSGNEDASDRAADLALDAARRQGSNHLLLQALDDVPAVLTRRLDAELETVSVWHEIGRARMSRTGSGAAEQRAPIVLHEFGCRELVVAGQEVKLPIGKSYELLSYLVTRPGERISRDALLGVLFDGRQDPSSRSYLRQAIRWLKSALPDDILSVDAYAVTLIDDGRVVTDATNMERELAEAAGLRGEARLDATLVAVAAHERGVFLPGVRAGWADQRELELIHLVTEARSQAASIALEASRHALAIRLARHVLAEDPARESAWQTIMRAAEAQGDQDGVIHAYRECERALAELGTVPSPTTRRLLDRLRH